MDGYSLKQLFVSYDESSIPTIDDDEEIGVRKKQYTFWKRKWSVRKIWMLNVKDWKSTSQRICLECEFMLHTKLLSTFSSWPCLKDSPKTLVRHTNMLTLNFFVDSFGWLMMQYKVTPTDIIYNPIETPLIQLWKVNANGSPKLPTRVPNLIPYCPIWDHDEVRLMEREKFINVRLSKYVEF